MKMLLVETSNAGISEHHDLFSNQSVYYDFLNKVEMEKSNMWFCIFIHMFELERL